LSSCCSGNTIKAHNLEPFSILFLQYLSKRTTEDHSFSKQSGLQQSIPNIYLSPGKTARTCFRHLTPAHTLPCQLRPPLGPVPDTTITPPPYSLIVVENKHVCLGTGFSLAGRGFAFPKFPKEEYREAVPDLEGEPLAEEGGVKEERLLVSQKRCFPPFSPSAIQMLIRTPAM
jgi:hypothetical protein